MQCDSITIVCEIILEMKTLNLKYMVHDQLDTQFISMYLFQFYTCFEQPHTHHQENQLYQYNLWYMSLRVGDRFVCRSERNFSFQPAHETVIDTEWHIPEVVLTQLILLMMSTGLLETWTEVLHFVDGASCNDSW